MDDVITETTSSISIQWRVFCTYIVSMLEMSPFKSVSITLVYTTFNYAPRTRHAAASPWCLFPLPVLAHAFACVAIGVWLQGWPSRHPPGTCSPRQRRADEWLHKQKCGRQASSAVKGDDLIGELPSRWEGLNHTLTLYSVAAAAASPLFSIKGLTCGTSVCAVSMAYVWLHAWTDNFLSHIRRKMDVKWASLIQL